MLKTAFFDLGNVLCFFSHDKMFNQLVACTGIPVEKIQRLLIDDEMQKSYELGAIDTLTLYNIFLSHSPMGFSLADFNHAMADIFTPNEKLWVVVEQLKKQNIKLILISNTCESHFRWIMDHYPILQRFDQMVLSFQEGLLKPDPKIFKKALKLSNSAPTECFYTDDVPKFVASARTLGIDGEVFINVEKLQQDLAKRNIAYCL